MATVVFFISLVGLLVVLWKLYTQRYISLKDIPLLMQNHKIIKSFTPAIDYQTAFEWGCSGFVPKAAQLLSIVDNVDNKQISIKQ